MSGTTFLSEGEYVGFTMGTPDAKQQEEIMKAPFSDNYDSSIKIIKDR